MGKPAFYNESIKSNSTGRNEMEEIMVQIQNGQRECVAVKEHSFQGKRPGSPAVHDETPQRAARAEQMLVMVEIGEMLERRGQRAYFTLLAPSLIWGLQ